MQQRNRRRTLRIRSRVVENGVLSEIRHTRVDRFLRQFTLHFRGRKIFLGIFRHLINSETKTDHQANKNAKKPANEEIVTRGRPKRLLFHFQFSFLRKALNSTNAETMIAHSTHSPRADLPHCSKEPPLTSLDYRRPCRRTRRKVINLLANQPVQFKIRRKINPSHHDNRQQEGIPVRILKQKQRHATLTPLDQPRIGATALRELRSRRWPFHR